MGAHPRCRKHNQATIDRSGRDSGGSDDLGRCGYRLHKAKTIAEASDQLWPAVAKEVQTTGSCRKFNSTRHCSFLFVIC